MNINLKFFSEDLDRRLFNNNMNALNDAINTKAATTGKHTIAQLITAVNSIIPAKTGQVKTVSASATEQIEVTPDAGYTLDKVIINAVAQQDTAGVSQLKASSIKQGVSIVGLATQIDGSAESAVSSASLPTLAASALILDGKTLTINNPTSNGSFVDSFSIFEGSTLLTYTTATTFDLSTLNLTHGTHSITVKSIGAKFNDSALSNEVSFVNALLPTPEINITSKILNITTTSTDTTAYKIYLDDVYQTTISKRSTEPTTFSLSNFTMDLRTYTIGVAAIPEQTAAVQESTKATTSYTYSTDGYTLAIHQYFEASTPEVTYTFYCMGGTPVSYTSTELATSWKNKSFENVYKLKGSSNSTDWSSFLYRSASDAWNSFAGGEVLKWREQTIYDFTINLTYNAWLGGEYDYHYCFVKGTKITLADYSTKNVEDITYKDSILTYDFDTNQYSAAKPCWIAKVKKSNFYWKQTFSDGTILKTVGPTDKSHRLFNYTQQKFIYPQEWSKNDCGFKQDKSTPYLVSNEKIYEEVEYYNFITEKDMNNFANNILCGCRLSNIYPIKDMKYVKDVRTLRKLTDYQVKENYFTKLRLAEQQLAIDNIDSYIQNLEATQILGQESER